MSEAGVVRDWVLSNDFFEGYRVVEGNDVYVPTANKKPHMHLNKDFVVYSKSDSNHKELIRGDDVSCGRNADVLQDSNEAHIKQICRFISTKYCS